MASVNKTLWFKEAIKAERWKEPGWVVQLFCVTELPSIEDNPINLSKPPAPFELFSFFDKKTYCYWDDREQEIIPIDGSDITEPLFDYQSRIKLNPGDIANVIEPVDTVIGMVIVNLYMLVYPFGDRIPFVTGKTDGENIQKMVISKVQDYSKDAPKDAIFPHELVNYKKSVSAMESFFIICSASASEASLTVKNEVLQLRDELLKKHKDELNNPAVIADIENQCVKYDMELRKGDVSDGFFMGNKKLQAVGRKKQMIMYGLEGGLDGNLQLVPYALSEGMRFEDMALYADSTTAASQSRGLLTAQGGELVKYILRIFQNATITQKDCGTTNYMDVVVDKYLLPCLPTRFMFEGNQTVVITDEMAKGLLGKRIKLRSPGYCVTPGRNFCECCTNTNIAARPTGIATTTSRGSSKIMNDAMKKMHGSAPEAFDMILGEHLS